MTLTKEIIYTWHCDICKKNKVERVYSVPGTYTDAAPTLPEGWRTLDNYHICLDHEVEISMSWKHPDKGYFKEGGKVDAS